VSKNYKLSFVYILLPAFVQAPLLNSANIKLQNFTALDMTTNKGEFNILNYLDRTGVAIGNAKT
jgi:hypothetical protein